MTHTVRLLVSQRITLVSNIKTQKIGKHISMLSETIYQIRPVTLCKKDKKTIIQRIKFQLLSGYLRKPPRNSST